MEGHAQKPAASYGVGGEVEAAIVRAVGVGRSIRVHVHSGMKEDGVSNPLRRKCSRLELDIRSLKAGARSLLRVGGNHGSGTEKDTSRGQYNWERVLHERVIRVY